MATRREFLQAAGAVGGCLAVGAVAPRWLRAAANGAEAAGRKLVVIELQGGNDGLNTVVPFADDAYYRARPTLAVKPADVIKLDDRLGLNSAMKAWQGFWDAGQLAIVENCGYPQPNRSHFASMEIWHSGQPSAAPLGWLGRAADDAGAGELCFVGDGAVPHALSRKNRSVAALSRLGDLRLRRDLGKLSAQDPADADELAAMIQSRLNDAQALSVKLPVNIADLVPNGNMVERNLNDRLATVRTLIEKQQPFRVYYTAIGGFDTHAQQAGSHKSLLKQTADAVSGFLAELKKKNLSNDVAVFLFSEFGRRVHENGSQGTDHGAAAPVFVIGEKVRGGLQGGTPDLADLDDGDVRYQVDFREVYGGLLRDWLAVDPAPAVGQTPGNLRLFG